MSVFPWTASKVPGLVVPIPRFPVDEAMVRYVVVPALRLLITPRPKFPMVVEANQWVVLVGLFETKSVSMN